MRQTVRASAFTWTENYELWSAPVCGWGAQNLITLFLFYSLSIKKISSRCVHSCLSYPRSTARSYPLSRIISNSVCPRKYGKKSIRSSYKSKWYIFARIFHEDVIIKINAILSVINNRLKGIACRKKVRRCYCR